MAGKTYESLYKQQTEVYIKWAATTYAVEHIALGMGAAIVLYGMAFTPIGPVFNLFGLLNPLLRYMTPALLAIVLAALSALVDPGKKPLLLYLWGAVSYFFKPKVFVGGHRPMKRWKGSKNRMRGQTVYTVSEGGIPLPAVVVGNSGQLHLKAATEAMVIRGGIWIRPVRHPTRKRAVRLPYGRITITHEGRGRIGYHR